MRWLDSITNTMNLSTFQERVEDKEAWCATAHEVEKSQTGLSKWTTTICNTKTLEEAE